MISGCDSNFLPKTNNNQDTPSSNQSTDDLSGQTTHTYSDEWSHDENYHWHACTDSGYEFLKSEKATHSFTSKLVSPTFEEEGYTLYTCQVCGYSFKGDITNKLIHQYSNAFEYDENYHWRTCTDSGYENLKIDNNIHTFKETTFLPTYDKEGYTLYQCTVCAYSYKDHFVSALSHTYSTVWSHDEN